MKTGSVVILGPTVLLVDGICVLLAPIIFRSRNERNSALLILPLTTE